MRTFLRSRILDGVTSTSSSSSMYSRAISRVSSRGRLEQDVLVGAGGPHVGELLLLARVDDHVVAAGVLGDDHPFVDVVAGLDEHGAALLEVVEGKGDGLAADQADHDAVGPLGNVALDRPVVVEVVVHDRLALGRAHRAGCAGRSGPGLGSGTRGGHRLP